MDTVLVTGGCGYIGSHTCISLLENNSKVLIIDSLVNSYKETFIKIKEIVNKKGIDSNKISFIKGDLRNKEWLDKIFVEHLRAKTPIKSVVHFAGLKSIESSINYPLEYWETNISITLSLLSIMKKYQCFNLIFSSSASIYKPQENHLLTESDLLEPYTPYGKTKLTIETILEDLLKSDLKNNWRIANLRYFNPVGSHISRLIFENPKENFSNLFPSIMKVLKGEQKKLFVYGNNWPTKDGTCIRDFIHVMDLAEAHIAALNYLISNDPQIISINIGTGKGTSILELIKTFSSIYKKDFIYEFADKRLGDKAFIVANNKRALELLDWIPRRTLFDICNDYVDLQNLKNQKNKIPK